MKAGLIDWLRLLRVHQWYKNLLVFLAAFFTGQVFDPTVMWYSFIGFVVLCAVSSIGYILNDIKDMKEDRAHPEKRDRPIAAHSISPMSGFFIVILLLMVMIVGSGMLPAMFQYAALLLLVLTQLYSFILKNQPVLDIVMIGVNFVLRAVSGVFILEAEISPWLILCTFFMALFLGFGKRYADLVYLGKNAVKYKSVFKYYTKETLGPLLTASTTLLIAAYALYSFMGHVITIFTVPIVVFGVFKFLIYAKSGAKIGRHPELIYKDFWLMGALGLLILVVFHAHYL